MDNGGRKILIVADAGGTKTAWMVTALGSDSAVSVETPGINASVNSEEHIYETIVRLRDAMADNGLNQSSDSFIIRFFGAGCNSDKTKARVANAFNEVFGDRINESHYMSDLYAAAIALFGSDKGVVCILGTGSASCYYDGFAITDNVPSLGYILGDEGSGAFMGKQLLNRYYKRELSEEIKAELEHFSNMELSHAIEMVYRSDSPGRYLASFVPFIKLHQHHENISGLIDDSLKLFFTNNVLKYKEIKNNGIGFAGGVAAVFSERLKKLSAYYGFSRCSFIHGPIKPLFEYYLDYYLK